MRKFGVCLVLTSAVLTSIGCGHQTGGASAKGGIAVVDLDKVAAETGKAIQMKEAFQLGEASLKQQLAKATVSANNALENKQKEFGEELTDEEKTELYKFRLNASNALTRLQNQAGSQLAQYKQDQISKFRTEIKPIAQEIAAKKGLSVVIPKNEGLLLSVDPGVDITEEVIKIYREKKPTPTPAPAAVASNDQPTKATRSTLRPTPEAETENVELAPQQEETQN